ncbi:putative DNA-binding domain-containing protein [Aliidiomarina sp.]|uniref:HvfC/BufC family peptide modification chaperone n=1 Tax=Aliidiomarina sp. TaxID=1872439 RepID=UPI003A4DE652
MQQVNESFYQQLIAYLQGETATNLTPWVGFKPEDLRRLKIYRNSSMKASIQALVDNFPVSGSVIPINQFRHLAKEYVLKNRPTHPVLAWYGQDFPDWLLKQIDQHHCSWLADLAKLERCWLNCLLAEDQQAVSGEDIAHLASEGIDIQLLTMSLCAHVELLETHFDVWTLWLQQRNNSGNVQLSSIAAEKTRRMLWRQANHTVQYRLLSDAEWTFIQTLKKQPCSLQNAVSKAWEVDKLFDVSGSFAGLLQNRLLRLI